MPGFDRTGPIGYGPVTGRGRGLCAGQQMGRHFSPRFWKWGTGWMPGYGGFRRRSRTFAGSIPHGIGRRQGSWYPWNVGVENEAEFMRERANALQLEVDAINKRLKELDAMQQGEEAQEELTP